MKKQHKKFFAIEQVRGGKLLSEIAAGDDHLIGYRGYILDEKNNLFTPEAIEKGRIRIDDVNRIMLRTTAVLNSYSAVRNILKKKGANYCIYCSRTIEDCIDYITCENNTRLQ